MHGHHYHHRNRHHIIIINIKSSSQFPFFSSPSSSSPSSFFLPYFFFGSKKYLISIHLTKSGHLVFKATACAILTVSFRHCNIRARGDHSRPACTGSRVQARPTTVTGCRASMVKWLNRYLQVTGLSHVTQWYMHCDISLNYIFIQNGNKICIYL